MTEVMDMATAIQVLNTEKEVSVKVSARYLGTTERTISNYLKSKQLIGKKVGKEWFIESESVLQMRPMGSTLADASLPPIENPKSASQESREKGGNAAKDWALVKSPRRSPQKLSAFVRLQETFDLIRESREGFSETGYEFFRQALFEVGDDLAAGYYSFGPIKAKLYGRARIRGARLVSRAFLKRAPAGFILSLSQLVEAIVYLCRSLEKRSIARSASVKPQKAKTDVTA